MVIRHNRWWVHTAVAVGMACAFMAAAAWQALPWWEHAFLSDDSPVSWLSSALLVANAAVAINLTLIRALPASLGSALAFSLAALAIDEQFLLHERFKEAVAPPLGNIPTLLIGLGGIVVFVWLNRVVTSRAAGRLFLAAIALGLFALWVDLGRPPVAFARLEEGFEVLAEVLFLSGLYEASLTCSRPAD